LEIKQIEIDKLTVVGNLNSELSYALQNATNEPHVYIKANSTGYIEGKFFSYGYSEAVYFCYDAINSQAMGKRSFRMEFNPSKITVEQTEWLKSRIIYILDDIGITRLDLAFDCDFDLSSFSYEYQNSLMSNEIKGRTGKIQTMYFGSRNSNLFYRIYDKKVELKEKQGIIIDDPILWRYEIEIKNAHIIDKVIQYEFPLFDDKRIIQYDVDSLPAIDNLIITGLLAKPRLMGELSKNTRTKYRKLLKNLGGNDVTPLFIEKLDKKKPELIREINSWLSTDIPIG
jgi:hypothetical protein